MQTADIYLITNLINGKQYVGQTIRGYKVRWKIHCYNAKHLNRYSQYIDKAVNKYGISNFKLSLIETVPIEQKDEKEIYYINKYNTYKRGYNQTIGGDVNPMFDPKVKAKHRKSMKSKEVREKISKSVKSSYTPELRQWFSEHSKNIWNNWTQEQKNNCVKGLLEYNNKQKQRIAALNKKDESLFKEFESASEACKYFGRPCKEAGNLLKVCDSYNKNGKRKSHYGYYWIKL